MTFSSRRLLAHIPILLALASLGAACRADDTHRDLWTGLYFGERKVGYAHVVIEPSTYRAKPALKLTTTSETHLEMFGRSVDQKTTSLSYTDSAYRPLYSEYDIASNGSAVKVKADYLPGKIVCSVTSGAGAKPQVKEIAVPKGANLAADSPDSGLGKKLTPGARATYYYLEPLTVTLQKSDMVVQARESVTFDGEKYDALRVQVSTPFGNLISWETAEGDMLKSELPLGMAMFRETKSAALDRKSVMPKFALSGASPAPAAAYVPPSDFALATAVAIDRPIKDPRACKTLVLSVSGVDDAKLLLSDGRQKYAPAPADGPGRELTVRADRFDPKLAPALPITRPDMRPYLAPAPYLETDNPEIRKIAADLRGSETNAFKVAVKIHDWVNAHMTPDYSIGVPRSCSEINGKRRGVCRDYATYFAGIARAAGIPTRLCGGIVCAEGKFFYHAWAECWLGRWTAFDPTMKDGSFVDATHVKFAQGDVTDMYGFVGIVGRIRLKVLRAE